MSRNQRTIQQQQQQRPLLVDGGGGGGGDEVPIITCTSTAEVTSTVVTIAHGRPGEGGRVAMDTGTNGRQGLGKRQSTGSLRSAWRLKYQDFVPGKSSAGHWEKSEPFSKLVESANDWLKRNPEAQVKSSETITWMASEERRLGDSERMTLSKSLTENSRTYFLRGLRLWLIPKSGSSKSQTISFTDIAPDSGESRIQDLVSRANRKIEHKHLKGRILTIETISVPVIKGEPQVNVTRWTESVDEDSYEAFVLRIFTSKESPNLIYGSHEYNIGIKDMVPVAYDYGYEGFELLTERTNAWLRDQTDSIVVINMQSVMVQKNNCSHSDTGGGSCFYTMPGMNSVTPIEFLRILRIAFVKPIGDLLLDTIPTVVYPFTYETFTPELVRQKEPGTGGRGGGGGGGGSQRERLEKMKETFSKVIAFLRNSGADVICSETVMNPMQMYIEETSDQEEEMRFLFTIRLFLTGRLAEDGSTRLTKRPSLLLQELEGGTDCLNDGGGDEKQPEVEGGARAPLFLRNVVGRQFKYRWLVLALSAFISMTIIVALSVVYSNR